MPQPENGLPNERDKFGPQIHIYQRTRHKTSPPYYTRCCSLIILVSRSQNTHAVLVAFRIKLSLALSPWTRTDHAYVLYVSYICTFVNRSDANGKLGRSNSVLLPRRFRSFVEWDIVI